MAATGIRINVLNLLAALTASSESVDAEIQRPKQLQLDSVWIMERFTMRILGLLLCLGLLAVPSAAKLKVGIDVDAPDDRIKSELKAGLAARFNSTDRYTVTDSAIEADIVLQMICVPVKMKGASYNLGVACATEAFYYPFKNIALAHHLPGAGSLVTDHSENLQGIIDGSANDLINATTDEKLSEYKKLMMNQVQLVCLSGPGICRLSPPKQ